MIVDFSTTNYALSHNIGREGNIFMSGIVSNPILFILTKLIGTMVIIFMMSKIIQKNEKMAKIGMRIIILMMLLVIFNNGMVISANALAFNNFSGSPAGIINSGNGYFDDEATAYGYTGTRNVYAVTQLRGISLVEPISYSSSGGQAIKVINASSNTLFDAVVHNGYLYFLDDNVIKKKKTRNDNLVCEANDTSAGGCISTIATGVGTYTLRVYDNELYFTAGTVLKKLDSDDNVVTLFNLATIPGSEGRFSSFTVATNNSLIEAYMIGTAAGTLNLYRCNTGGCSTMSGTLATNNPVFSTLYTTTNYIYALYYVPASAGATTERIYAISNGSATTTDYITTNTISANNRAYVSGETTIGLAMQSTTSYETYNSNEAGISSLPTVPTDLEYETATIESLESQYYNKSTIYLNYNVIINSLNANNILLDFNDYRWMISMTDPNGVTRDVIQSPACSFDSLLDTTCQVFSSMGINAPPNGWLQGVWTAKLYEINTVTSSRALVSTSTSFTVLNTTEENQSIIPPPFIPPTSGTAPQTISIIDGFVSWLGLGVNSVSKLLFAMIIIAIAATVGLIWGNGNIAMVFAFVPYSFFTFIDYIPKWIFIITIILMAIVSRVFR